MPRNSANPRWRASAIGARMPVLAAGLALAALALAGAADAPASPLSWPVTGQAGVAALAWNGPRSRPICACRWAATAASAAWC
jgi:hypothetical protein